MKKSVFICIFLAAIGSPSVGQEATFEPLFNGRNLDGWVRVNTDESTWRIQDGILVCSGKPIGELRTVRMYQNFVLELEWRHMKPRGNAGIFVWADDITAKGVPFHRSIEVQVLENAYGNTRGYTTHGDIFPIHGAKMTPVNGRGGSRAFPIENRSNPSPQWNHYRIECRDGDISLAVNGKVVTRGKNCSPRKGYICIESEGGIAHYRNVRIQELADTEVEPQHVAIEDRGYRCLYTGIDLNDWSAGPAWRSSDWQLINNTGDDGPLATKERFADVGFLFDYKFDETNGALQFSVGQHNIALKADDKAWHRVSGRISGGRLSYRIDGLEEKLGASSRQATGETPLTWSATSPIRIANIYVRDIAD